MGHRGGIAHHRRPRTRRDCPLRASGAANVIERVLVDLVRDWNPDQIAIDARSPANVIERPLTAAEAIPTLTNTVELTRAAGSFLDAIEAGQISHSDQTALNDAAVSAIQRDLAGGSAWGQSPGLPYLNAASLAAWSLLSATESALKRTAIPLVDQPTTSSRGYHEPAFLDLDRVSF